MANLLGQDIGLNYKGLINIGSTINQNISASLQSLTDGDGNLLPIQVSTTALQLNYGVGVGGTPTTAGLHVYGQSGKTGLAFEGASAKMYIDLNGTGTNFFDSIESRFRNAAGTSLAMNVWGDLGRVAIGGLATNFTPSASLHVRGDGTNPIARFETSAGAATYVINAAGNSHTFTGLVDVSDVVNVAATRGYFWTNRGGIATSGDGIILLRNNNNTDFNRLQFGGTTSSFPSLKRSTTALQARLADDSDFTFIQGKLRTETNFTADGAVTSSGYIVLYDLDGTAYKVLATPL